MKQMSSPNIETSSFDFIHIFKHNLVFPFVFIFAHTKTRKNHKMTGRKLNILYGSQTGTAQDVAEYIWRESKKYHFVGTVLPMDEYDVKSLIQEQFVIFVCSTTGQGNEPDNMKEFWKFILRKSLPKDSLCGLSYAVLGLGDSSYSQFNFVAKRLNRRLQQLGAVQIIPVGLCDDQHDLGPSAVYISWINDLWEKMLELRPLEAGLSILTESPRNFRWSIEVCGHSDNLVDETKNIFENCTKTVLDGNAFCTEVLVCFRFICGLPDFAISFLFRRVMSELPTTTIFKMFD